ncbi:hypothetical protein STSO111631_18875 [Stackebrandtia soli]
MSVFRRALVCLTAGAVAFATVPSLQASADPLECSDTATTEGEASALAVQCGHRVEVLDSRTPYDQLFAEPDGTMTAETAVEPQRSQRPDGTWHSIDVSLEPRADGRYAPSATVADVSFSQGGDEPLVELTGAQGSTFTLDWPGSLPQPSIDGDSATYSNVLDDVDLVVRATPRGFTHVLVVKTAEAAADPALSRIRFDTGGDAEVHPAADGGLRVIGDGENLAAAAPATMWDSTDTNVASRNTSTDIDADGPR